MKTIFHIFDKHNPAVIWQLSLLLVLAIIIADVLTGNIISCEPFLIFPIILTSWYGSKRTGVLLSVLTTIAWLGTKLYFFGFPYISWSIILDGITQLISYILLAIIITNFRKVHKYEEVAADTDSLTGLLNPRGFYVEMADELLRSIQYKHTFSLAYIDIDNFKSINDSFGHETGDRLLKEMSTCLKSSLRKTDKIARIGGDEFVCLLPNTNSEVAKEVFTKVIKLLCQNMESSNWKVTFSIGMMTFDSPPNNVKQAVNCADELMYSVKNGGKNNIIYKKI